VKEKEMKHASPTISQETKLALTDVVRWSQELDLLHARMAPYFARPEPHLRALAYLQALLSDLPRKNSWQIAEHAREARPDGMQRLLASSVWDADLVRDELRAYVLERPGDQAAIVVIDETSFPKRGKKSVGVQVQYCGTTGQCENCQVGVFLSYLSPQGHTLLDRELYVPMQWFDDQARCREAGIPETTRFQTKCELASTMVERVLRAKIPIRWVVADCVYGSNARLRAHLHVSQCSYVLAVRATEPVELQTPTGRMRMTVAEAEARFIEPQQWQRLSMGEGTKGPRWFDWACLPLLYRGIEDGCHFLLMRRLPTKPSENVYYLAFAPVGTTLAEMVQAISGRWSIEIVQPQMTKTEMLAARSSGDHIADLHLLVGHDNTINQQLDQMSFLLKGSFSEPLLDSLAKGFN
jgi:SRSO17 transposase